MSKFETKVIGYISYVVKTNPLCSGDACIIAGTEESMRKYISRNNPADKESYKVSKTRYGDILGGLKAGAAYAFDEQSYKRFQPIAIQEGCDLSDLNFDEKSIQDGNFLILRANSL